MRPSCPLLGIVVAALASSCAGAHQPSTVRANYGIPINYAQRILDYPDFRVQLRAKQKFESGQTAYIFLVLDKVTGKEIGHINVLHSIDDHINNFGFELGKTGYLAEMFWVTPGPTSAKNSTPLIFPDTQIVVWDKTSALACKPRLLKAWNETDDQLHRTTSYLRYASGAAIEATQAPLNGVRTEATIRELDTAPRLLNSVLPKYPEDLVGSGFIGAVRGAMVVNNGGSVIQVVTLGGNDLRFTLAVEQSLLRWKFTPPEKNGITVTANVFFRLTLDEKSGAQFELLSDLPDR